MTCLPTFSVRPRIACRIILCGVALTALQGCATTAKNRSAAATAEVATLPAGTGARKSNAKRSGYSDPSVVAMGGNRQPMPASTATQENPAIPQTATASLADAVMQPAAINAGRTSIFAPQQEPMPAEAASSTMTAASLVPAEMPTRRVSPMTGSLFSAPQYASADPAGLPGDEQAAPLPLEDESPTVAAGAPAEPDADEAANADPVVPVAEDAPAQPSKKTLFPILGRLLGKAKS